MSEQGSFGKSEKLQMVGLGLHIATGLDDWVTDDETVMLDQTCPGINLITPDLPGPRQSLSILVHNSVPDEYVQFVVLHELREGEFIHVDEMSKAEAHNEAKKITDDEARRELGRGFNAYKDWEHNVSI